MNVEYVPLLQLQREIYDMPRGMERFRSYMRTMRGSVTDDLALPPLVAINPMARDHVPALLDEYLQQDTDTRAAEAAQAAGAHEAIEGSFKVSLVMADDLKGGWTNRHATDFEMRFHARPIQQRGWITGILWSSEPAAAERAARTAAAAVHRTAYLARHGAARTLGEMLAQEGYALGLAGFTPTLDADDIEYSRSVIVPHRNATDRAMIFACLFGDRAATALGYPPHGLSEYAGLELATADAGKTTTTTRRTRRGQACSS